MTSLSAFKRPKEGEKRGERGTCFPKGRRRSLRGGK